MVVSPAGLVPSTGIVSSTCCCVLAILAAAALLKLAVFGGCLRACDAAFPMMVTLEIKTARTCGPRAGIDYNLISLAFQLYLWNHFLSTMALAVSQESYQTALRLIRYL